jgi:hypothetical protein
VETVIKEVTMTTFLKACPRCQGDVHINKDMYGEYKECLQCGYMVDIVKPSPFAIPEIKAKKKAAKAA